MVTLEEALSLSMNGFSRLHVRMDAVVVISFFKWTFLMDEAIKSSSCFPLTLAPVQRSRPVTTKTMIKFSSEAVAKGLGTTAVDGESSVTR